MLVSVYVLAVDALIVRFEGWYYINYVKFNRITVSLHIRHWLVGNKQF